MRRWVDVGDKKKVADAGLYPSENGCTLRIEEPKKEVLGAATLHAVTVTDTRTVRNCAAVAC